MTTSANEPSRPGRTRLPAALLRQPVHLLALGFGAGLAPVAPGTFGSIVGVVLGLAVAHGGFWFACGATALATLGGVWICGESARRLGVHDHPAIVWDEVAGMMLVLLAAPATWWGVALAFGLFRLFDIWKPWLVGRADRMEGATGVMLDDLWAGLFAGIVSMGLAGVYHGVVEPWLG